MPNNLTVKSEIKDLQECIRIIYYNLGRIDKGCVIHDKEEQEEKLSRYLLRLAELENYIANVQENAIKQIAQYISEIHSLKTEISGLRINHD